MILTFGKSGREYQLTGAQLLFSKSKHCSHPAETRRRSCVLRVGRSEDAQHTYLSKLGDQGRDLWDLHGRHAARGCYEDSGAMRSLLLME
eukprot:52663-Eustigmatos_ZCMA.PRE.1